MVFLKCVVAILKGSSTTNLSDPTLLNKVKEKNTWFSIKDIQWIQLEKDVLYAHQCSAGDKDKGSPPTGTDRGPGMCTASVSQFQELLIDAFIMDFNCM